MRGRLRPAKHGAKFEAHEPAAAVADALLLEQNRPLGNHADDAGDDHRQRQEERQRQQDGDHIQRPFPPWNSNVFGVFHFPPILVPVSGVAPHLFV